MTREQADQVVREMLSKAFPDFTIKVHDYWQSSRGLRVSFNGQFSDMEATVHLPRAEAQILVDAGVE